MIRIFSELITRLSEDYKDASGGVKVLLFVSVVTVCVIAGLRLFQDTGSASMSGWRELGLSPLVKLDEDGNRWELDLVGGQSVSEIKRNIKAGPPLVVTTEVQKRQGSIWIGLIVRGRAGERYVGGVKKNGRWRPAPAFKIIDDSGKVLHSGTFEYG